MVSPVSTTHTLHPAIAGQYLSIPAVAGIVSHLIGHVLSEPQSAVVNSNLDEEELDPGHEVAQGLIGHNTTTHCLSNAQLLGSLSIHLIVGRVQIENCGLETSKLGMVLLCWVTEMFNLSHRKLSHSDQT